MFCTAGSPTSLTMWPQEATWLAGHDGMCRSLNSGYIAGFKVYMYKLIYNTQTQNYHHQQVNWIKLIINSTPVIWLQDRGHPRLIYACGHPRPAHLLRSHRKTGNVTQTAEKYLAMVERYQNTQSTTASHTYTKSCCLQIPQISNWCEHPWNAPSKQVCTMEASFQNPQHPEDLATTSQCRTHPEVLWGHSCPIGTKGTYRISGSMFWNLHYMCN